MSKFVFDDVMDVIRRIDLGASGIVIGGQALSYWCKAYMREGELAGLGALASKDLDYRVPTTK